MPDPTLDPSLRSWVESANEAGTDFPLQNLPVGMVRRDTRAIPAVPIGTDVLDLAAALHSHLLHGETASLVARCEADGALNVLLAAGRPALTALRAAVCDLLTEGSGASQRAVALRGTILVDATAVEPLLPARTGDYSDFYASIHHATNVGRMFRPDNPLLPNYKWVPIGYHGRASSLVPTGTRVRRPGGQTMAEGASAPVYEASRRLDYELEVGVYVGAGNALGEPIAIGEAESHVAGLCLVNDWSARDLQTWEYQPLGPFLAKSFATTVSPWIVTLDALAPFRAPAFVREDGDPAPMEHLHDARDQRSGGFDIRLEVLLTSARMRAEGYAPMRISSGSFTSMYWTVAQLLTHHASNGCNLTAGDLIASGTVSGAEPESRGCLLERTWRGTEPLALPTGEVRRFLEDGDEVTMRGWCEREGYRRIGFGECRGVVSA